MDSSINKCKDWKYRWNLSSIEEIQGNLKLDEIKFAKDFKKI